MTSELSKDQVTDWVPHRDPFLLIDRIVEVSDSQIECGFDVTADKDFFRGHYPDYPIMPGVLLQECMFQAGAILLAQRLWNDEGQRPEGVPVVSRVNNVKYRSSVHPGDVLQIQAQLKEVVGKAFYMNGSIQKDGKKVASLEFTCMLLENPS